MYLWDTNALAEDLKAGRVSQREKMKYVIAFILLGFCVLDASWWCADKTSTVDPITDTVRFFIFWTLSVAITIAGVMLCYQANRHRDGIEFIDRFVCINCPIAIRLFALMVLVFASYFAAGFYLAGNDFVPFADDSSFEYTWKIISFVFEIIYYWRVRHHLFRIASSAPIGSNVA